jgi:enoyl-CoA hydratase
VNDPHLLYHTQGPVAWLTLNRPDAMNAIDLQMATLYEEYLPKIAADNAMRVLVLTGNGSAFCTGVDLTQAIDSLNVPPGEQDLLDRLCDDVLGPLRNFPKPVIAALNGITLAGGLEMAMCADIVVASDHVEIGDAHANFGVYPGAGGAALLPRIIPHNVAKYLLLTGKTLSAQQMMGYGFVNELVASDQLINATQHLAEHIAQKSPLALQRMKAVANHAHDNSRDAALAHEQVAFRKHLRSYDMQEGLKAFAEKREPKFIGR